MEILDFKSQLQQIASDAGFSAVGITDPLKVDQTIKERFRDFIKNDWNAGMDWMEKRINERIEPENLWPNRWNQQIRGVGRIMAGTPGVEEPMKANRER